jgi:diguanylate cyclase (GGDEF)-like protein
MRIAFPPQRTLPGALALCLLALLCALPLAAQGGRAGDPPLETLSAVRRDADRDRAPDRTDQRVRVRGVLASTPGTHDVRGSTAYLVDHETGVGLYAPNGRLKGSKAGELVEVVGEVGSFNGAEQIRVERVTRLGTRPLPAPVAVEVPALYGESYAGRIVRVRGTLRVARDEEVRRRFSLAEGTAVIPLYVPEPIHESPRFPLTIRDEGREVEVVGFASQFDREPPYTSGYQLVPRSSADIRLRGLSRAALWGVVGALGSVILAGALVGYRLRALRLHRESHTDAMTGLLNRRGYEAALQQALRTARKTRTPLALLVVDLDDFKRANDEHGHLVGDAVLRAAAAILVETVRGTDVVARYAGDEFVVLLPRLGDAAALEVGTRIVQRLRTVTVEVDSESREIPLGASVGVSVYKEGEETNGSSLFRRADTALYQSKREGKGQARFALRAS